MANYSVLLVAAVIVISLPVLTLFIIFDVEAIFIYPWAVILKSLRWFGVAEMGVFVAILLVALIYIWAKGALEWGD